MASKRVFQALFAVLAVVSAYISSTAFLKADVQSNFPAGAARLRVLGMRGGGIQPGAPALTQAGLLLNGCRLPGGPSSTHAPPLDSSGAVPLGQARPANGYYFVTNGSGGEATDPLRWVVEVQVINSSGASEWLPVGASVWQFTLSGALELFPALDYSTPYAQIPTTNPSSGSGLEAEVHVDGRPPLSWRLGTAGNICPYAVGFLLFAVAGASGHPSMMLPLWAATLVVSLMLMISGEVAVAVAEPWMWRAGALQWIHVVFVALLLAGSVRWERHLILFLLAFSMGILLSLTTAEAALYGRRWSSTLAGQLPGLNFVTATISIAVMAFRRLFLARARRLIHSDRQRYDALWESLLAGPEAEAALRSIADEVRLMTAGKLRGILEAAPRQRAPVWSSHEAAPRQSGPGRSESLGGALEGVRGLVWNQGRLVSSLDQLFVQVDRNKMKKPQFQKHKQF